MSKRKRYFDITLSVMRPVPYPDILISISYLVIGAEESGQIRASGRDASTRTQLERDGVGQRDASTLTSMNNLATVLRSREKYERAEEMLRQYSSKARRC
jgi:Tetratricopeptide repeat